MAASAVHELKVLHHLAADARNEGLEDLDADIVVD
jgi:hypothetical protein